MIIQGKVNGVARRGESRSERVSPGGEGGLGQTKILGIDYGDKRVGLAVAEFGSIAVPLEVVANNSKQSLLEKIKEIILAEDISIVVVGLPHSFSGEKNERLSKTQKFIDFLQNNLETNICTVDEQLTSKLYSKMGVKKDIDKHSATAILDTFLTKNNEQ